MASACKAMLATKEELSKELGGPEAAEAILGVPVHDTKGMALMSGLAL